MRCRKTLTLAAIVATALGCAAGSDDAAAAEALLDSDAVPPPEPGARVPLHRDPAPEPDPELIDRLTSDEVIPDPVPALELVEIAAPDPHEVARSWYAAEAADPDRVVLAARVDSISALRADSTRLAEMTVLEASDGARTPIARTVLIHRGFDCDLPLGIQPGDEIVFHTRAAAFAEGEVLPILSVAAGATASVALAARSPSGGYEARMPWGSEEVIR